MLDKDYIGVVRWGTIVEWGPVRQVAAGLRSVLMRGGAAAARRVHCPEVGGSNPSPATTPLGIILRGVR